MNQLPLLAPNTIGIFSPESIGQANVHTDSPASTSYFSEIYNLLVPFRLAMPAEFGYGWAWTGDTVSGNFDVGIYDAAGTLLASTGAVAMAASGAQVSFFANGGHITIGPGLFYMAIGTSAGASTSFRTVSALVIGGRPWSMLGVALDTQGIPLPATVSFSTFRGISNQIPIFGISKYIML